MSPPRRRAAKSAAALGIASQVLLGLAVSCASAPRSEPSAPPVSSAEDALPSNEQPPFVNLCRQKGESPRFCACAYEEYRAHFALAPSRDVSSGAGSRLELSTNHASSLTLAEDEPALRGFRSDVRTVCGAWSSEPLVRQEYLEHCMGTDFSKAGFCQCAWTQWRRRRPLALFAAYEPIGADEIEGSDAVAESCQGSYPPELARAEYLAGCAEGDPSKLEACLCLWERLSKRYSVEQLVLGAPRREHHFGSQKPGPLEKDLEACASSSQH